MTDQMFILGVGGGAQFRRRRGERSKMSDKGQGGQKLRIFLDVINV